jgi:hypothetical protein
MLIDIGAVATLGSAIAFAVLVVKGVTTAYRRTVGRHRDFAARLSKIACGVRIEHVERVFGLSTFRHDLGEYVEDIFVADSAYLHTLSHRDGTVLRYSVTAVHPRFRPTLDIGMPGSWPAYVVRLGKNHFADVPGQREGFELSVGARRLHYAEAIYCGNPGGYQTFVLAHSDAGQGSFGDPYLVLEPGEGYLGDGIFANGEDVVANGEDVVDRPGRDEFRRATTVNTLTVIGPLQSSEALLSSPAGADLDQVRTLPTQGWRRYKLRRWSRRYGREVAERSSPALGATDAAPRDGLRA